jgi:hypothetical protein
VHGRPQPAVEDHPQRLGAPRQPRGEQRIVGQHRAHAGQDAGRVLRRRRVGPSGFEKLLVIKRILSQHHDKHEYLNMFLSEARLVAYLTHSNIIQIHEMGQIRRRLLHRDGVRARPIPARHHRRAARHREAAAAGLRHRPRHQAL